MTSQWINLIVSLPGKNQALRMRVWRKVKTMGAGILRDGAYLLPFNATQLEQFEQLASEIITKGGVAHLIQFSSVDDDQENSLQQLFDRSKEYSNLLQILDDFRKSFDSLSETDARKQLNGLIREYETLSEIDFFPGEHKKNAEQVINVIKSDLHRKFSPDEPVAGYSSIKLLNIDSYQKQLWATRQHMWVDRVASAWLIKHYIDKDASFIWLKKPADCPDNAFGFDFNGAQFTHIDDKVTFEVLIESFGLQDEPGLMRLAELIHYLDVGGMPVAEAKGLEMLLIGAREKCKNDDQLLMEMSTVFGFFLAAFAGKKKQ